MGHSHFKILKILWFSAVKFSLRKQSPYFRELIGLQHDPISRGGESLSKSQLLGFYRLARQLLYAKVLSIARCQNL